MSRLLRGLARSASERFHPAWTPYDDPQTPRAREKREWGRLNRVAHLSPPDVESEWVEGQADLEELLWLYGSSTVQEARARIEEFESYWESLPEDILW